MDTNPKQGERGLGSNDCKHATNIFHFIFLQLLLLQYSTL